MSDEKAFRHFVIFFGLTFLLLDSRPAFPRETLSLDPVVVTASRVEEGAGETGSAVTVVTAEEIAARGDLTLSEALRGLAGVTVQSYQGRFDFFTGLTLRGSETHQTLFLIDGVEINSPYDQQAAVGPLDVMDVERVEVVRGPRSALYGSQAMGGVIQIFTRDGEWRPGWEVSGEGGGLGTFRETLAYSHPGTPDYRISYARFDTEGDQPNTAVHGDSAGAALRWRLGNNTLRIALRYRNTDEAYERICCALFDPLDFANPIIRFYSDPNAGAQQDWALFQVAYTGRPSERTDYRLDLSRVDERTEDRNPSETGVVGYYPLVYDIRSEGVRDRIEFQQNFRLDEGSTLTLLTEYKQEAAEKRERSNIASTGLAPVETLDPVERTRRNGAVAVQYRLEPRLEDQIGVGYRLDRHSRFGNAVSPSLSWSHRFSMSETRLHAAYGNGFRAPSFEENFDPFLGNPDLRPEESESYEAGIQQPLMAWEGRLGWTVHRTRYRHLIQPGTDPADPLIPIYVNVGRAEVKGHEFTLFLQPRKAFSMTLDYATLETEDLESGRPLPFRPRYSLHLNFRYWGERWTVNGDVHRVSDSYIPFGFLQNLEGNPLGDRMPDYTRVDAAASYRLIRGERETAIYLRVDNLLDEPIEELSGFPLPGRTLLAGVRASF